MKIYEKETTLQIKRQNKKQNFFSKKYANVRFKYY